MHPTLSFFHTVYNNKKATEFAIKSVRQHYPDSLYMIINDGGVDHSDLVGKYNCEYLRSTKNLGYPVVPYGHKKELALEWLKRFYISCIMCNSSHIMMMEDDVVVLDKITLQNDWECAGHPTINNIIPEQILEIAEKVSGVKPNHNFYGAGGGTIFNVRTVIENFGKVYNFYNLNYDTLQNAWPTMGWLDCYMTYFFYLSGKHYSINEKLGTVSPWPSSVTDFDLETVRGKFEIVDRYKNNYENV